MYKHLIRIGSYGRVIDGPEHVRRGGEAAPSLVRRVVATSQLRLGDIEESRHAIELTTSSCCAGASRHLSEAAQWGVPGLCKMRAEADE
ncbi:MAG TPA: hypothetical protein VFP81_10520 [Propionibacteriaceae bacterium]|nr:hypothetical protein [Propionibacteriaceae bacterium]